MILVCSGWGVRVMYTLGILKVLEETKLSDVIQAWFGVSSGAVILTFWFAGYQAEEIYHLLVEQNYTKYFTPNLLSLHKYLIQDTHILDFLSRHLPRRFSRLHNKLYIGAVDLLSGEYELFHTGELVRPLLGSMSIPGLFPWVPYKRHHLVDGGVLNNFPVDIAKAIYPDVDIIWVGFDKVESIKTPPPTIFGSLLRSWDITIDASMYSQYDISYLFYQKPLLKTFEFDRGKWRMAFDQGYQDARKIFDVSFV